MRKHKHVGKVVAWVFNNGDENENAPCFQEYREYAEALFVEQCECGKVRHCLRLRFGTDVLAAQEKFGGKFEEEKLDGTIFLCRKWADSVSFENRVMKEY